MILIISAAICLPTWWIAAAGRAPTNLQLDWFYTRNFDFCNSPVFLATRIDIIFDPKFLIGVSSPI